MGLLQATDGNFYGITSQGQRILYRRWLRHHIPHERRRIDYYAALIFRCRWRYAHRRECRTPTATFTATTNRGGSSTSCDGGCGTFFKLGLGLSPFVEALPAFGNIGGPVAILGTNLTTASAVSFNGTAVSFQVVLSPQNYYYRAHRRTTGKIRVTVVVIRRNHSWRFPGRCTARFGARDAVPV